MLQREEWLALARKLDWRFSYVGESDVFPEIQSGKPGLSHEAWEHWEEPFKTSYPEYVKTQSLKEISLKAVHEAVGRVKNYAKLSSPWLSALKFYSAVFSLAEYAAAIGELRIARFGKDSAWRTAALLGALDELRHAQIPLLLMQDLVKWDPQFDWTHKFYYTDDWVAIAARHLTGELLAGADSIEFAVATNFVFETGFTNLQFVGLSQLADNVGDHIFENMVTSIQSDEARHAQIGPPVLSVLIKHDRKRAQYLLDKWLWRSWLLFSVLTGFSMDYLTPLSERTHSFKEFMEEWIINQYIRSLDEYGMKKPWYWEIFLDSLDLYHHMVYASAYTYRATTWFNYAVPGPEERAWLRKKYPKTWDQFEPVWERIEMQWEKAGPGNETEVHGKTMVTFCDLCQLVLCGGTPANNTSNTLEYRGENYIFCSQPCRWIFESEPERYASHKNLVKRILAGEAPGNLPELLTRYFQLTPETWGKDAYGGQYAWKEKT